MNVKIGINPDLLEQRRPAVARRRDAARGRADRRQADRLPGLRARQQVPARIRRRCARCCPRTSLELVSGWYSGRLARRSVEEEIAAVGPHLKLLADNGAKVMVYGEVADSIQGAPQPLYKRPRFFTPAQWDAYADRRHAIRAAHARARRARRVSPSHGRVRRSAAGCRRAHEPRRRRGGPAVRQRPHDLRRRRRGGDAREARQARVPRPLQGRAAGRDQARAQPQLELPRVGDQRRVHRARRRRRRLSRADGASCARTATRAGWWSRPSRIRSWRRATRTRTRDSARCTELRDRNEPPRERQQPRAAATSSRVTPQSAGWKYVGFAAHRLAPGRGRWRSPRATTKCASSCCADTRDGRRRRGRRGARSASARACSPTRRRMRCTCLPARAVARARRAPTPRSAVASAPGSGRATRAPHRAVDDEALRARPGLQHALRVRHPAADRARRSAAGGRGAHAVAGTRRAIRRTSTTPTTRRWKARSRKRITTG